MMPGRCFFPGNIGIGFRADVDGVFQAGRYGAVVFGSHEQYAGRGFDGFAELGIAGRSREVGNGRIVVVEVVQRQMADFNDLRFVAFGEHGMTFCAIFRANEPLRRLPTKMLTFFDMFSPV